MGERCFSIRSMSTALLGKSTRNRQQNHNVCLLFHLMTDSAEHEQLVETACVYHDLGLWTDHKLAYLEPSEAVALRDNQRHAGGLDPEALGGLKACCV